MPVSAWSGCRVEILTWGDAAHFESEECEVRLDDTRIVVSYFDDSGPVVLAGAGDSAGHYRLVGRSRPRRATLHRTPGELELAGTWVEGEERGLWRVVLSS